MSIDVLHELKSEIPKEYNRVHVEIEIALKYPYED
jgi:hypothetical protein